MRSLAHLSAAMHTSTRACGRCGVQVERLYDPAIGCNVDIVPVSGGDTDPLYVTHRDGYRKVRYADKVLATHTAHHCAAPARCRMCEQVHQTPSDSVGLNNNSNSEGATP